MLMGWRRGHYDKTKKVGNCAMTDCKDGVAQGCKDHDDHKNARTRGHDTCMTMQLQHDARQAASSPTAYLLEPLADQPNNIMSCDVCLFPST
jgi:hypothetical protein